MRLDAPYRLDPSAVPESADLVVIGNPTNPTSVLHPATDVLALRRPGRILVVDEAFMDAVPGESASVAGYSLPDVLVLRSLTKTWALAGLRCGYALGHPDVLDRLTVGRPHWPVGSLQLEAIAACSEPAAVAEAGEMALRIGPTATPRWRCCGTRGSRCTPRLPRRSCCCTCPTANACAPTCGGGASRCAAVTPSRAWAPISCALRSGRER